MWDLMAKTSYGIVNILGILQVNSYDFKRTGADCISNNSNSTSLQSALFKHMYVVVISFFYLGQFIFFLCFNVIIICYHTQKQKKNKNYLRQKKIIYNMYFALKYIIL